MPLLRITPFLLLLLFAFPTVSVANETGSEPSAEKISILDGKQSTTWKVISKYMYERHGNVSVKDGVVRLEAGDPATGIRFEGDRPTIDYELSLEARRIKGNDFFCGVTFPIGKNYCSLIVGGWGGQVVGLSNINDEAAIDNETCDFVNFEQNRWYSIRLQVTKEKILVWLDGEKQIDVEAGDRNFSIWLEQEPAQPLGITTWHTSAEFKNIRLKKLNAEEK